MRFAPEGIPFITAGAVLAGAAWLLQGLGIGGVAVQVLAPLLTVAALFVVWFFRDPPHPAPSDPRAVLAPGQGKVIGITEVDEPTFMGGRCRRLTIFLSVFDVHVQRAPVTGTVEHRSYKPGQYLVAWLEKASEDNEQASLGLTTPVGRVLVRQIAGLIARRIVTDHGEGDAVRIGERIGLIRFGSRVDLFVPLSWEVTCALGDRVVVGHSVMARMPEGAAS